MKKFFALCFSLMLMTMVTLLTSCGTDKQKDTGPFEYSLIVDGATEGAVDITFAQGIFSIDGTAGLNLRVQSDTIYHISKYITTTPAGAIAANGLPDLDQVYTDSTLVQDARTYEAAKLCIAAVPITVTSATGKYDITIKGYIREPITGITFVIDRHLHSKPDSIVSTSNL